MRRQLCACGRVSNPAYGAQHWCCITCERDGTHTIWCDQRAARKSNAVVITEDGPRKLRFEPMHIDK